MVRSAIGPGRILTLAYAFFVLAAGARSIVQLSTHASRAPVAYVLSAVAALIYLAGALVMAAAERQPGRRRLALRLLLLELTGVIVIGTVSVVHPATFPDATVWSYYGSGYGYVPLVLPLLAMLWLRPSQSRS